MNIFNRRLNLLKKLKGWHFALVPITLNALWLLYLLGTIFYIVIKKGGLREMDGFYELFFLLFLIVFFVMLFVLHLLQDERSRRIGSVFSILIGSFLIYFIVKDGISFKKDTILYSLTLTISSIMYLIAGVTSFFERPVNTYNSYGVIINKELHPELKDNNKTLSS